MKLKSLSKEIKKTKKNVSDFNSVDKYNSLLKLEERKKKILELAENLDEYQKQTLHAIFNLFESTINNASLDELKNQRCIYEYYFNSIKHRIRFYELEKKKGS